jgi:hypothetical protein
MRIINEVPQCLSSFIHSKLISLSFNYVPQHLAKHLKFMYVISQSKSPPNTEVSYEYIEEVVTKYRQMEVLQHGDWA